MAKQKIKTAFIDFEFNGVKEKNVNLVCAAVNDGTSIKKFWLHNKEKNKAALWDYLSQFQRVIAYAYVAEGRSLFSLLHAIRPNITFAEIVKEMYRWEVIDLFTEYRMITNNNDRLQWGKQLVDGKVKTVRKPRPKWEQVEGERSAGFRATHSLAEATYKLTGEIRDTDHKTAMRDLIISAPKKFKKKDRKAILDYCAEDVEFLPQLWDRIIEEYLILSPRSTKEQYIAKAIERGEFLVTTAIQESIGYPVEVDKVVNFAASVPVILTSLQREINRLFPEIKPFKWHPGTQRYSWRQKETREWVAKNHDLKNWMLTDKGQVSLSLEAFQRFYDYKHTYPEDVFGAQIVRYLKLKQSLNGFSTKKKRLNGPDTKPKKTFFDHLGSDGFVRPYLNPYGAQSSRSQPAATAFMFLKPAWTRALVEPPKGYYMGAIDYGSEEFFISALISRDRAMIAAYLSGDPYLYFAKMAGAVPKDGKREDHEEKRDLFKSTTLGLSYLMSKYGLAAKLTLDTKKVWSPDDAQEMIDLFYDTYSRLKDFQDDLIADYGRQRPIVLADGWTMWGDNDNFRSVANMPIQGAGAVIMRRACNMAMRRGVYVPFALHDALFVMGKIGDEKKEMNIIRECMIEAFASVFPEKLRETAVKIKLDPYMWSKHYKDGMKFDLGNGWSSKAGRLYVDDRSIVDYKKFSPYFNKPLNIF